MSEELKPTDEQCDRIVALTMDKLAAKGCDQYGDMHALDLNPNIMEHHSLRRSIVRAAYGVGEAEAIAAWNRRAQPAAPTDDTQPPCKTHPNAPHGFNRHASLNYDRYVCDCELWEAAASATDKQQAAIDKAAAFARGHDAGWASHVLHVSLQKANAAPACECAACKPNTIEEQRMILCSICGNKRCPHATDHRHACTNSNEYGQPGSVFGGIAHADAAPSVAPEPVAWTTLIEIDWVKRNAGRAGSFYAVKAGPNDIPLFAHPPRAPLTEEQKRDLVKECDLDWQRGFMPLFDGDPTNRYAVLIEAVEAAHGIGGK